jgi:magnesium-protoporphyrin O-methyltransferase
LTESAPEDKPVIAQDSTRPEAQYQQRRGQIEDYFDRTAMKAWEQLTSTAPVGRIRATVRAGRDRMRAQLLAGCRPDLHGLRILDAGCGTGALAMEAAHRGAHVVAIDLSPRWWTWRSPRGASTWKPLNANGHIDFRSGDFTDASLGEFDYVVAMDSLIHYNAPTPCGCCRAGPAARAKRHGLHLCAQQSHAAGHEGRGPPVPARQPRAVDRAGCREDPAPHAGRPAGPAAWQAGRTQRVAAASTPRRPSS